MPLAQEERRFTYRDYLDWPENERWEILGGKAYSMTPAPGTMHQRVLVRLTGLLEKALEGSRCTLFVAPTDVVLSEEDVVQPDLFIVCDPAKITPSHISGPPDLIIEITSPTSVRKDRREKKALYERAGIREYIVLDPEGKFAERWVLDTAQRYGMGKIYAAEEDLPLSVLDEGLIPLGEIWGGKLIPEGQDWNKAWPAYAGGEREEGSAG